MTLSLNGPRIIQVLSASLDPCASTSPSYMAHDTSECDHIAEVRLLTTEEIVDRDFYRYCGHDRHDFWRCNWLIVLACAAMIALFAWLHLPGALIIFLVILAAHFVMRVYCTKRLFNYDEKHKVEEMMVKRQEGCSLSVGPMSPEEASSNFEDSAPPPSYEKAIALQQHDPANATQWI